MPVSTSTPRLAAHVTKALAALEIACGLLALRATLLHAAEYPSHTQLLVEIGLFGGVVVTGLRLWRRRRWAARVSQALLYVAFFAVLTVLSLSYERAHQQLWYWLFPLLLPVLGFSVYSLRQQHAEWIRRW